MSHTTSGCTVGRHRSHVPIEHHHVWPTYLGGPNTPANRVLLCADHHSLVHEYLTLLVNGQGKTPWVKAIRYGPRVRALARRGYDQWAAR